MDFISEEFVELTKRRKFIKEMLILIRRKRSFRCVVGFIYLFINIVIIFNFNFFGNFSFSLKFSFLS